MCSKDVIFPTPSMNAAAPTSRFSNTGPKYPAPFWIVSTFTSRFRPSRIGI